MWPWEHLAVGYLLYSLASRSLTDESPSSAAAMAVALGTQFPDLVDKPLAWSFDVLQSSVSVAHSVFVATALSSLAILTARRFDRTQVGAGFAVGYLAHLPADMLYPVIVGKQLHLSAFFWPLFAATEGGTAGFLQNFTYYLAKFVAFLGTPRGMAFIVLEATLVGMTTWLWISDGCPGLPRFSRSRPPLGDS